MLNRTLLIIAALGILAWATYVLRPSNRLEPRAAKQDTLSQTGGIAEPELQGSPSEPDDEPGALARRAQQLGEAKQSELRKLGVAEERFPHDVSMEDYKASLWTDIQANPPALETPGDPALDAETAYRQYMYYGMCTMAPRTGGQIDRRLDQIAERAETASGRYLRGLESRFDQMIDLYELCRAIPPEVDRRLEAVVWMTEAVRLGHEIAQVQFYEKAIGFLLRADRYREAPPLVMLHPQMIDEFKTTARFALDRAQEKGHPEAFLAMSRAVYEGVVYPKDPVLALAYARVAELTAMENHIILRDLAEQIYAVMQHLDGEQRASAEEMSHRIRTGHGG